MTFSPFHVRVTFLKILLLHFLLQHQKFSFPLKHREPQGSAVHQIPLPRRFKVVKIQILLPCGQIPPLSLTPVFLFAIGCALPPSYAVRLHLRRLFEQGVLLHFLPESAAADSHNIGFLPFCSLLPGVCNDSSPGYRSSAVTSPKFKLIFMTM